MNRKFIGRPITRVSRRFIGDPPRRVNRKFIGFYGYTPTDGAIRGHLRTLRSGGHAVRHGRMSA